MAKKLTKEQQQEAVEAIKLYVNNDIFSTEAPRKLKLFIKHIYGINYKLSYCKMLWAGSSCRTLWK